MQIKKSRNNNFYFPVTILKQLDIVLSIFGAQKFGAQVKGLVNYCHWQKGNYLSGMNIDREENACFYLKLVYVHSTLSANVGMFMDNSS